MYAVPASVLAARAQFPITRNCIYFDIANMNSPPLGVTGTIAGFFAAMQQGSADKSDWVREIEKTRRKAATLLGCEPGEIAFVKNTSEGLNISANAIDWRPGDNGYQCDYLARRSFSIECCIQSGFNNSRLYC